MRFPALTLMAALAALLSACASLPGDARKAMGAPEMAGVRWGMVVMTMDGKELASIRPDERFIPASNTKLFTVAAALHRLGDLTQSDPEMTTGVRVEQRQIGGPDIVLVGRGDAMVIDADDCEKVCLSSLADQIVAGGITTVHDVIGDDQRFPDERWGPGWSVEDLQYRRGAPVSALVVNSNEVVLEIRPGEVGQLVIAQWREDDEYFELVNETTTVEGAEDRLRIERLPGSQSVRIYGSLGVSRAAQSIPLAVDDPALAAAWRLKRLLEERGVKVEGSIKTRHRPTSLFDDPEIADRFIAVDEKPGSEIARLAAPPLIEDIRFLTKQSQNLHAEVLLRLLAYADVPEPGEFIEYAGSRARGLALIEEMLTEAGADRRGWDFSDGSGMSVYNRASPRMIARFLHWTTSQPWAAQFRDTLAVGGVDGTVRNRFRGTPLEGKIFAKTGTLEGTNAVAGFMTARSGKTLIFSVFANDRPSEAPSATAAMDAALNAIAAAH